MLEKIFDKSFLLVKTSIEWRFVRYIIVGGVSAVLELGTLILLVEGFEIPYLRGNIIAFSLIVILNYVLSRKWVFQSSGETKKRIEFLVFMFFVGCGFIINQSGLWFFANILGMHYEFAKVVSIVFVVIWNYFTRKHIIFKRKELDKTETI